MKSEDADSGGDWNCQKIGTFPKAATSPPSVLCKSQRKCAKMQVTDLMKRETWQAL